MLMYADRDRNRNGIFNSLSILIQNFPISETGFLFPFSIFSTNFRSASEIHNKISKISISNPNLFPIKTCLSLCLLCIMYFFYYCAILANFYEIIAINYILD